MWANRFVPECSHAQESHTCEFFLIFFLSYLHDHGSLRSRNFATVTTRGSDFSCLIPTHKFIPKELIEAGEERTYFATLGLRRMDYTIMATNTIRRETNMYDKIKSICFHKLRRIED